VSTEISSFLSLGLSKEILSAVDGLGYEAPSAIQARTIPPLLAGRDVLGQAQTGTGKTAAFALPLIDRLDDGRLESGTPQVLVLTPTRELAIQVAEAFQSYASFKPGFHVLPIYGGQPYPTQVRPLKRGVHVVVGTPGRVMDHVRRGTLKLGSLKALVLDEADEMLAMGFIEDVTWLLEKTPPDRQVALFSATMPPAVRRLVKQNLTEPEEISIESSAKAASTIHQRYLLISHWHKLDALTRMLEIEPVEGMLIFVRTKTATVDLAEKLEARGHAAAALNGDMAQPLRERTVGRFKEGKLDFLVATDVAARGLDVDRISHVLNYDIPHDPEGYIHRIGRTGRAGRSGEAILFVTPREKRMFHAIERTIGESIELMTTPSTDEVNRRRIARFKDRISEAREEGDATFFEGLIVEYIEETGSAALDVAVALAQLVQGSQPLLLAEAPKKRKPPERQNKKRDDARIGAKIERPAKKPTPDESPSNRRPDSRTQPGMQRYRIEVGHEHGVKPGQIVGALTNEAGLDGKFIGRIDIRTGHSLVDLPDGMPPEIFKALRKTRLCSQFLHISRDESAGYGGKTKSKGKKKGKDKDKRALK
jgi:ATP-dependent RNA helicase DeaD